MREYVEQKYGFKVHIAYIAEAKSSLGLTMYDAPDAVKGSKDREMWEEEDSYSAYFFLREEDNVY